MIKFENVVLPSSEQWLSIIMGTRSPLNSWDRSDSEFTFNSKYPGLGSNDFDLMMRLSRAGTDHRKFMRMIVVYVDITAPMYWLTEFDTYKVGTVSNSTSKMHRLTYKPFEISDFSFEHLICNKSEAFFGSDKVKSLVDNLNQLRNYYFETKDKHYWYSILQLLPCSYNQKRTVMLNYEVLANIYKSRKGHKLDEWKEFCEWIESLPYSELITGKSN